MPTLPTPLTQVTNRYERLLMQRLGHALRAGWNGTSLVCASEYKAADRLCRKGILVRTGSAVIPATAEIAATTAGLPLL